MLEESNYQSGSVSQSDDNDHDLIIPSGTKDLKIMVYWHDKEASPSSTIALVNDLDIQLTSPNGTVFQPWVLDPTPNIVNLSPFKAQ